MTKITSDFNWRAAPMFMCGNPRWISCCTIRRAGDANTRCRGMRAPWEKVIVIDDDLGRSGGGTARPGLNVCWRRSAAVRRERSLLSKPRA